MTTHILRDIAQNFLIGGSAVAITSYLGTFMSPLAGAIFWAYPITILPSIFFMRQQGKNNTFIAKFLFSTTFALILLMGVTLLLSHTVKTSPDTQTLWIPVLESTGGFLAGALAYFLIIKGFGLEHYFM
jgi:hypothetical protein